ncbi:MAG: hypothetical protein HZC54_18675 [Verrucomicrobia bacterium]|nr:hypothetical protein [Verrucomicrobiota bacterium]
MYMGLAAAIILLLLVPGLLGWIIPLAFGIGRIRKKTGGVVLTVVGGVWGLLALCFGGLVAWSITMGFRAMQVEDFDPAKFQGKTGKITLAHKAESELVLMSFGGMDTKRMRFKTLDGVFSVPEGKYFPFEFAAFARDPAGAKWKATCQLFGGAKDELSVSAESSQELAAGPPFTAKVKVSKQSGNEVAFDLKITGQGGHNYAFQRTDAADTPPGFEVVGPDGKVVLKDKFHFG